MDKAASLPDGAAGRGGGPDELLVLPIYAALPPDQQMRVGADSCIHGLRFCIVCVLEGRGRPQGAAGTAHLCGTSP